MTGLRRSGVTRGTQPPLLGPASQIKLPPYRGKHGSADHQPDGGAVFLAIELVAIQMGLVEQIV